MLKQLYKKYITVIVILFFVGASVLYVFPMLQGLILLPLDLLISNYSPWSSPGQILLKNPYMQDSVIQMFPWKHLVYTSLRQGIIPFWNPYQFLGMPFLAGLKTMVFYPFNLFFVFSEATAWNLLLYSQLLLSLVFSYLLARDLRFRVLPSIFVSFSFAFSSLMVGVLQFGSEGHVLLWTPLLFFCTKRYFEKKSRRYLGILSLAVAFSIFAGQLQYTGIILFSLALFGMYMSRIEKSAFRNLVLWGASIGLGVGITSVQLLPSIELFQLSYRGAVQSSEIYTRGLIHVYELLRLFSPDFFGNPVTRNLKIGYIETSGYFGILPLFFSLYCLFFCRKNKFIDYFKYLFLVGILLSLKEIGSIVSYLHIPLITSGSADRLFLIVLFSGSILSGCGLNEFFLGRDFKRKAFFTIIFVTIYAVLFFYASQFLTSSVGTLMELYRNIKFSILIISTGMCAVTAYLVFHKKFPYMPLVLSIIIVGITYFDLFRLGYRFLTFSNEKFFYPEVSVSTFLQSSTRNSMARVYGLAEPELSTFLQIRAVDTYNPLYLLHSARLLEILQKKENDVLPVNKYFVTAKGDELKYTLDFLGVGYIVVPSSVDPAFDYFGSIEYQKVLSPVYKDDKYTVYKNEGAHPRFGLFYKTIIAEDDQDVLSMIKKREIDLEKTIILNEKIDSLTQEGSGSASLVNENMNELSFQVTTNNPGIFYLSDTYYSGWRVYINEIESKLYKANYNFRAVEVPSGTSTVRFQYRPVYFHYAIYLSISSFILSGILALWPNKHNYKK